MEEAEQESGLAHCQTPGAVRDPGNSEEGHSTVSAFLEPGHAHKHVYTKTHKQLRYLAVHTAVLAEVEGRGTGDNVLLSSL